MSLAASSADRPTALRQRVFLLCHLIRWISAAWTTWALALIVLRWSDRGDVARSYGRWLKTDLSALPSGDYLLGLGLIVVDWAAMAVLVAMIWRTFGRYLHGDIFSRAAADDLRFLGWAGVVALFTDLAARPLLAMALTRHVGGGANFAVPSWLQPNDLLHLTMALFIVALGHVFRAGVEIADDHRQIV